MKRIKRILKVLVLLVLMLYIALDIFIYYAYKSEETEKHLNILIDRYKTSDSIPDNLISAYKKVYPGSVNANAYPDPFWYFYSYNKHYPQKELAAGLHIMERNNFIRVFKNISAINQIDNRLSNKQCIYGCLNEIDYSNLANGLDAAASIYYSKTLKELTERECIEIVIMSRNPSQYNKIRHPEALKEKVKEYLK